MTHETCKTIKVAAEDKSQGDYILINVKDFDADKHTKFGEKPKADKPAPVLAKTAQDLIDKHGLNIEDITPTGQDGGHTVKDVKAAVEAKLNAVVPPPTPVAVKSEAVFDSEETATLFNDMGLSVENVTATGENGLITTADLEKAVDTEGVE